MTRNPLRIAVVMAAFGLMACGGPTVDPAEHFTSSRAAVTTPSSGNSTGSNDNGTGLSASCTPGDVQCTSDSGGTVTLSGTVTSTGSVDSVVITASINGGEETQVGLIEPTDFSHDGRIKTVSYSVTLTLDNGTYSVELCFTQSGAQGRKPKRVCTAPITITVDCAPHDVCAGVGFFGDLVGNSDLCTGNGPPHIPVHVKGDFGEGPTLTITGPNGYSHSATMDHAGESCVYQYNWDTAGNGGAGEYTFAVSGNGHSDSFTAELHCH